MLSICFIYIQSKGIFIVFLWHGEMHKYIKNYNRYYIKWNNLMTCSHFWSSYNEYVYSNDSSKAVIRFWNSSRLFLHHRAWRNFFSTLLPVCDVQCTYVVHRSVALLGLRMGQKYVPWVGTIYSFDCIGRIKACISLPKCVCIRGLKSMHTCSKYLITIQMCAHS